MIRFSDAVASHSNSSLTHNGAKTNKSSLDPHVDLFFQIGASRGKDLTQAFERAYQADRELALRILLWARDVRAGAGERQTFKNLIRHLERNHFDDALLVMEHIPTYGRWDDLFAFETFEMRHAVAGMFGRAYASGNALAAKWSPRKGKLAWQMRSSLGMSPKQYRKTIVGLTKVVEQQMCAKEWNEINFEHVPSVAASRYRKAFMRNARESYEDYVSRLSKGEAKINASAIFPHDVLRSMFASYSWNGYLNSELSDTEKAAMKAQWEALPNLLGDDFILPMIDVSGSMDIGIDPTGSITAMQVACSIGAYLADKQSGAFKDTFLTFTNSPTIVREEGDVFRKLEKMFENVGYNTDFEAAYREILRVALEYQITPDQMPKYLLVLSDMEFDSCQRGGRSVKLFDAAKKDFELAGYQLPKMVFWNLKGRGGSGNSPVTFREDGTALVSGYSQNILKGIMSADMDDFTPLSIMMNTVNVDRYDIFS